MRHFPDLSRTTGQSRSTATAYRFVWGSDWAVFTINDATGEFGIQSSWGRWAHRWHTGHVGEGKTLTAFLAERSDAGYVVDKLGYGAPPTFRREYAHEATIAHWKALIARHRRCGDIASDEARGLWELVQDVDESVRIGPSEQEADAALQYTWNSHRELWDFLGVEDCAVWDTLVTRPSWEHEFLRLHLLPFFFSYLREHVL